MVEEFSLAEELRQLLLLAEELDADAVGSWGGTVLFALRRRLQMLVDVTE